MNKTISILAGAALSLTLTACLTPSTTPYKKSAWNGAGVGYSEKEVSKNVFKVQFAGNSLPSIDTAKDYVKLRGAEICRIRGMKYFSLRNSHYVELIDFQGKAIATITCSQSKSSTFRHNAAAVEKRLKNKYGI